MFCVTVLTLFPDMFPGALAYSITGRALQEGVFSLHTLNIRDFATDKHRTVDDTPYGGGAGMVMRPDVVAAAIDAARSQNPGAPVVYLSPAGTPLSQVVVQKMAEDITRPEINGIILLCGHYEGVDQRVLDSHVDMEISLGDFVLTGGEIAVFPLVDALVRLLPGVVGNAATLHEESFSVAIPAGGKTKPSGANGACLLEYPHYTRPEVWQGVAVPPVLKSGHHGEIANWRHQQAEARTRSRRPDLFLRYCAHKQEQAGPKPPKNRPENTSC